MLEFLTLIRKTIQHELVELGMAAWRATDHATATDVEVAYYLDVRTALGGAGITGHGSRIVFAPVAVTA